MLARNANYPDALSGLIGVLSRAGKSDEALQLIDRLSAAEQARLAPSVHIRALRATQVAKLAERRGDLTSAQKAYKEALADDPKNPWIRFALARVYLRQGQAQVARDLIDELLKQQPDQPDALYTSTLLSAELGEWSKALRTLSRIPAAKRSTDMNEMELDIRLHVQTELAVDVARRGQRQDAWGLLSRCEPLTRGKPERVAVLASAYAEAGNPDQAVSLMRDLLDKSESTPDLQLLYAGVLLKADRDAEASEILRQLQGKPMGETASKRYEDLVFLYRVKQADELREKNDLVAAYDMLSPALQQRPNDSLAISSLARMYAASGNVDKARNLYEPLIKADPGNARLQLGLADIAMQGRDYSLAEHSVEKALELEPGVPLTLTASARIYREMGKTGEAARLLRKAIEIENGQRVDTYVANVASGSAVSSNPFVGLAGQRLVDSAAGRRFIHRPERGRHGTDSGSGRAEGSGHCARPGRQPQRQSVWRGGLCTRHRTRSGLEPGAGGAQRYSPGPHGLCGSGAHCAQQQQREGPGQADGHRDTVRSQFPCRLEPGEHRLAGHSGLPVLGQPRCVAPLSSAARRTTGSVWPWPIVTRTTGSRLMSA